MNAQSLSIVHYNLTTTTKRGGVETLVWELSKRQAAAGFNVTIIGGAGREGRAVADVRVLRYPFVDRMRWRSVRPLRRHIELTKLLERLSMLPAAWPALVGLRPQIVHLHKPYDAVIAPLVHAWGGKVIYHGHGEDFFPGDRLLMRGVDAMLSCSSYNAETLVARYGGVPEVVFNGFDAEHFVPQAPDPVLRARYARPDEKLLLVVGRLQPWKGVQYAIQALAHLPADVRLLIGGEGTYEAALRRLVEEQNLHERVTFLGALPHRDLRHIYGIADIVLGTSFASETFGMVLCEALACARPVIASDWAGFREVVVDGVSGWIVPRQNPQALAQRIAEVLGDAAAAQRRALQGRAHVLRLFTWEAVAARVAAAYGNVVGGR